MVEASARTRSGFLLLEDRALITLPLLYCLFALSSVEESGSVRVVPVFSTGREPFFPYFFFPPPPIFDSLRPIFDRPEPVREIFDSFIFCIALSIAARFILNLRSMNRQRWKFNIPFNLKFKFFIFIVSMAQKSSLNLRSKNSKDNYYFIIII